MRVLSVDFDYFINASEIQMGAFFPDGGHEHSQFLNDIVWANHYASAAIKGHDLMGVSLLSSELRSVRKIIERQKNPLCMVADSHSHAYNFIKENCKGKGAVEVYTIDYHHDTFNVGDEGELNCGNWLRLLMEEGIVNKAFWVNRPKSDERGNMCEIIPFSELPKTGYDLIYVCRSSWWTPPHLDREFIAELAKPLSSNKRGWFCRFEKGIAESRYNKEFQKAITELTAVSRSVNDEIEMLKRRGSRG